jgi:hypothetical protein
MLLPVAASMLTSTFASVFTPLLTPLLTSTFASMLMSLSASTFVLAFAFALGIVWRVVVLPFLRSLKVSHVFCTFATFWLAEGAMLLAQRTGLAGWELGGWGLCG